MDYQFPPDVATLVQEQMTASGYGSEDDVLRDALRVFREVLARWEGLQRDVDLGIQEADYGLARPLDVSVLIDRCSRKLAEEGILD